MTHATNVINLKVTASSREAKIRQNNALKIC